ncbi:MAG: hypothetical protein CMK59_00565 [Proteobacteria bacterium]|nr:hypothetical protein [Pseudomonadota bacterium]
MFVLSIFLSLGCDRPTRLKDMASEDDYPTATPSPLSMRRLTTTQYENIIVDLFNKDIVIPPITANDSSMGGLLSIGASTSSYTASGVESLENAAFGIAEQVCENEHLLNSIIPCSPNSLSDEQCAEHMIRQFGKRAWRRPLSQSETDRYTELFLEASQVYQDFNKGVEFTLAALLQSPHFLYRIELGAAQNGNSEERMFSDTDLASRLSFFLWNTIPDEDLLAAAERGELKTREGLFEQALRMIEDPKIERGIDNFYSEYLHLYELDHLHKDPTLFEHYNHHIGQDAREETLSFLRYLSLEAEADFRESLTSKESFINSRLAAIYNIPSPNLEGDFGYIEHPPNSHRQGILGQVSFLALHSHSVSTSATLRGSAVRNILLCQEIPPAPVNVDTSIPEASGTTLTLRDRVDEHLEDPSCAGCHLLMDPIGLGLENFDSLGLWRTTDNGATIDATGDLDGTLFNTPTELSSAIANHSNYGWCLSRTLSRYATGRIESSAEQAWVEVLNDRLTIHEFRIKPLLLEVVMSPFFRNAGPLE